MQIMCNLIQNIIIILLNILKLSNSEFATTATATNHSPPDYSSQLQTVSTCPRGQCADIKNITDVAINAYDNHWQTTSILMALIRVAINRTDLVAEQCRQDLKLIQESVLQKQPWAIKVLDSSAPQPTGFVYQQNFWFGSYGGCLAANEPLRVGLYKVLKRTMKAGLTDQIAPFKVDFRVVYLRHNSPWQIQLTYMTQPILHLGLCLPVSCSSYDIHRVTQEMMQRKAFPEARLYEFQGEVLYVKDLRLKEEFFERRSWKIMMVVLVTTGALILCAGYLRKSAMKREQIKSKMTMHDNSYTESEEKSHKNGGSVGKVAQNGDNGGGNGAGAGVRGVEGSGRGRENAWLARLQVFVQCFDLSQNWWTLFGLREYASHEIPAINGIRFVLALCVVEVHVAWFARYTINNAALVQNDLEKSALVLQNLGLYLVDGFLTISGFLQIFLLLRDIKLVEQIRKNSIFQNTKIFLVMLTHRYLRLAPLYFVTMCTADLLSAYLHDVSLFHIYERDDLTCPQNWWRNLFFIQNYYPYREMCVQWSWTLSCEMQYFVCATIATFIYLKHPKFIKRGVIVLFVSTIIYAIFKGVTNKYQFASESVHLTMDAVYINPLVRVTPFIVGCVTASHFLTQPQPFSMSPLLEKVLWHMALLLFFGTSYTMDGRDLDYMTSSLLYTLGRLMMSFSVAWIIFGSASGRSCWWSQLLEARIFQHFNRLAYAIYLVNPLIISLFAALTESSTHIDLSRTILSAAGITIVIYAVAVLWALLFEIPYCTWSRIMLKGHKEKTL